MSSPQHIAALEAFGRLLTIMDELREKCPWDRDQTLESLRHLTLEETYELSEAISAKDHDALAGELGDLFLHLVFYARIGRELEAFTLDEVLNRLCDKLIRRHPHVYGDVQVANKEDVSANWERIKVNENAQKKSVLQGVPQSLPSLLKAYRMQEKVSKYGFDWDDPARVLDKVEEELGELRRELNRTDADAARREDELGDLLFSLVNFARHAGLNPDDALERTNRKFRQRFQFIEQQALAQGRELAELSLEEMEALWQQAKTHLAHP